MKRRTQDRTYERYDKKAQAFIFFNYDFTTKIDLLEADPEGASLAEKYPACCKNVSAEGLCFTSMKKLKSGEAVHLELYLQEQDVPICMEGEVRWSQVFVGNEEEEDALFDTGVRLISVEGKPVEKSIYFDKEHHVIWSEALECILGKYKEMIQERKEEIQD